MKIALVTNFNIYEKASSALKVACRLLEHDCTILVALSNRDKIGRLRKNQTEAACAARFRYIPFDILYEEADAAVVLGGDGTILEASRRAAGRNVPIIGVNLGRIGYMAEIEMNELELLDKFFTGEYNIDERTMLSVELMNSERKKRLTAFALNDAVISNGSIARIIDLELYEGGNFIMASRSDGLIISTPTGSTAYSMSAGGPIADPRLNCLCVTPVCPYAHAARPIIFPDEVVLEVKNTCIREKYLCLTVDGKVSYEMHRGDIVRFTKANIKTKLVRIKEGSFYNKLRQKLRSYD